MKGQNTFMTYLRKTFLILVNPIGIVVSVIFVISGLAGYINPSTQDLFAVAGLFYPVVFAAMFLGTIISALLRTRLFFVQLILLMISLPVSSKYFGLNLNPDDSALNVITYNVHGFKGFRDKNSEISTHESIITYLKKQQANVVCLQEFRSWTGKIDNDLKYFAQQAGYDHYHFSGYWRRGGVQSDGYLILSKLPIINKGSIPSETKRNIGAYADIQFSNNQVIRFASVHLISFSLGKQEIEAFGEAAALEMDLLKKHGRSLLGKLRNSFTIRSSEVIDLQKFIEETDLPMILGGDFNDTPASFTYNKITGSGLNDSHLQGGLGLGTTYGGNLPFLRIDYVFFTNTLRATGAKVHQLPYSDHNPVQATIFIQPD